MPPIETCSACQLRLILEVCGQEAGGQLNLLSWLKRREAAVGAGRAAEGVSQRAAAAAAGRARVFQHVQCELWRRRARRFVLRAAAGAVLARLAADGAAVRHCRQRTCVSLEI